MLSPVSTAPSFPSPYANCFQIAYVTRDMEAAVRMLGEVHGVTGFRVAEFALNLTFPAGCTVLKVGLAWVGEHEFELIEPVMDETCVFAPALPAPPANLAFHHFCMRVSGAFSDWQAFRADIPAGKVVIEGGREGMRFIFTDERATIGHYMEYIWTNADFLRDFPHRVPPSQRAEVRT